MSLLKNYQLLVVHKEESKKVNGGYALQYRVKTTRVGQ